MHRDVANELGTCCLCDVTRLCGVMMSRDMMKLLCSMVRMGPMCKMQRLKCDAETQLVEIRLQKSYLIWIEGTPFAYTLSCVMLGMAAEAGALLAG